MELRVWSLHNLLVRQESRKKLPLLNSFIFIKFFKLFSIFMFSLMKDYSNVIFINLVYFIFQYSSHNNIAYYKIYVITCFQFSNIIIFNNPEK